MVQWKFIIFKFMVLKLLKKILLHFLKFNQPMDLETILVVFKNYMIMINYPQNN